MRADSRDSGFTAGFILGGVVFGALGFLFAPQISRALLGEDDRLRLPRVLADDPAASLPRDPEAAKQDLIDKIAQLNASIDEVASQLRQKEDTAGAATTGGNGSAAAAAAERVGAAVEQALG